MTAADPLLALRDDLQALVKQNREQLRQEPQSDYLRGLTVARAMLLEKFNAALRLAEGAEAPPALDNGPALQIGEWVMDTDPSRVPAETLDLEPIKKRLSKASPGSWAYERLEIHERARIKDGPDVLHKVVDEAAVGLDAFARSGRQVCGLACTRGKYEREEANGQFIAHAKDDIPALIAEVERLRTGPAPSTETPMADAESRLIAGFILALDSDKKQLDLVAARYAIQEYRETALRAHVRAAVAPAEKEK